jgi:hypothetical protein
LILYLFYIKRALSIAESALFWFVGVGGVGVNEGYRSSTCPRWLWRAVRRPVRRGAGEGKMRRDYRGKRRRTAEAKRNR